VEPDKPGRVNESRDDRSPRSDPPSPLTSPTTFSPLDDSSLNVVSPERAPGSPDIKTAWGGFVLLEELGRGGFGVVYRAWDAALKRDVALKIIDARRLPHATEDAVLREGQMMARVRHPNVVTVFSAQRIGDEIGLAMDYIKGRTLSALVAEDGPLSAHEAALIGISLCDALSAVHRLDLVHRDLKASNVMRESGGRIVLMDFGAGRDVGTESDSRHEILGTPVYMPPELLMGSRGTPLSDIYSLGVLLYNLVTNQYPVRGVRADELRMAHLGGERISLAERRPELPARFVSAVEKALSPDPKDRFQSAVAFKRELSEAMPHLPPDSGGRRRRAPRKDARPSSDRVTPAPVPVLSRVGLLQRFVVGLGATISVCWVLGFLTTVEFNLVLGRSDAFRSDGVFDYLVWGVRALIAPVVFMLLTMLVVNVLRVMVRVIARLAPVIVETATRLEGLMRRGLERVGLNDPNALAQVVSVFGFASLVAIVWTFRNLLNAAANVVDDTPLRSLLFMSEDYFGTRVVYRRCLELLILILVAAMWQIYRRKQAGAAVHGAALTGPAAVTLLALLLLVGPWRLMFQSSFEQASLAGLQCSMIGETATEFLLHCPGSTPPRNHVVSRTDARLRRLHREMNLFDGYNPNASRPAQ
jgi:serine/threonine protein kinase